MSDKVMFEEELKELGLTDNEVRIYLLLLRSGPLTPAGLAAKAGLHRPSAYDSLERMVEKGVVSSITIEGKRAFQAVRPEALVELLRFKVESMQSILPGLQKMAAARSEAVSVQIHKGRRAYRELLKDLTSTVKDGETVCLMGVEEKNLLEEIEPIYLRQYFTIIKEKRVRETVIVAKGKPRIKNPNVEYREFDPEYIGDVSHIIYGSKVAFFIVTVPYYLIIIENPDLADTMRRQFNFFWDHASKPKK